MIVGDNRPRDATAPSQRSLPFRSLAKYGIPVPPRARLFNALGNAFQTPRDTLAGMLSAKRYDVVGATGTVEELRAVFYMDAHGGLGKIKQLGEDFGFAVWTATAVTPVTEKNARIQSDLGVQNLVYMTEPNSFGANGRKVWETHYAFTAGFVTQHMSFGPNSLVFMNACSSHSLLSPSAIKFRGAITAKGAAAYAGWTEIVRDTDANFVARYVFDRLLGANGDLGSQTSGSEQARPLDEVLGLLSSSVYPQPDGFPGVASGQAYVTKLGLTRGSNGRFDLLVPVLQSAALVEGKLLLTGSFGDDPRPEARVLVNGNSVDILEWKPAAPDSPAADTITCAKPESIPGPVPVVVEVRNHRSNEVTISPATLLVTESNTGVIREVLLGPSPPTSRVVANLGDKALPIGIASDGKGNAIVAEFGQASAALSRIDLSSGARTVVRAGFKSPFGVGVTTNGDYFMTDAGGGEIYAVRPSSIIDIRPRRHCLPRFVVSSRGSGRAIP